MKNETSKSYNGWKNYKTWNIALWIGNDEFLYNEAKNCIDYKQFTDSISGIVRSTGDGVDFLDSALDIDELDGLIQELSQ